MQILFGSSECSMLLRTLLHIVVVLVVLVLDYRQYLMLRFISRSRNFQV